MERTALEKGVRTGPDSGWRKGLGLLRDELKQYLPDVEDTDTVLTGLVRALVAEEVTRQTITKQPMIPGLVSDVCDPL